MNVAVRLLDEAPLSFGIIEGRVDSSSGVLVAASLNDVSTGSTVVRCCNPTETGVPLRVGAVIGYFQSVTPDDVKETSDNSVQSVCSVVDQERSTAVVQVPNHVVQLYQDALAICQKENQAVKVAELLTRYSDVFSSGDHDIGRTDLVSHSIPVLPESAPIKQAPRRLGPEKELEVEKQIEGLLDRGMIEPGDGAWASPVVLVRKKDSTWRFCVDYRRLNDITVKDAYPLPRIDDTLDALAGSQYFSTLDLLSGYWQVPLDTDAQEKSAFVTRGGLWKWKVLPFGLTSATATFERLMEMVLRGLHWKTLLIYLDDVIVFSNSLEEHCDRLAEVFQRLRSAGLKLKPSKCELFRTKVNYLGHVVSSQGVSTDPDKVKAVQEWPTPQCLTQLKAFLGTVGYYRRYIPDYATIAKPLTRLTSKKLAKDWDDECNEAFKKLKESLVSAPVLGYPDPALPYVLDTDASKWAVGAVLSQVQEGRERVIAYFSKTFSPAELNYCTTRKELLAVIKAIKHFRPYLYGRKFTLRTDHASLIWLCKRSQPSDQVARWLESLAEMDYKVIHRPGSKHSNADGLSRSCCEDCKQCQRVEKRDGGPTRREVEEVILNQNPPNTDQLEAPPAMNQVTVCPVNARTTADVISLQKTGDLGKIYQAVHDKVILPDREIQLGSWELQRWHKMIGNLRIRDDGILEVRLGLSRPQWVTACPQSIRKTVIWETHSLAHQGIDRTTKRLLMHWYWPGATAEVRRQVRSCEVCQSAKHSSVPTSGNRQRLHAGRPWQTVAVDLVGPLPETERGNVWILVYSDHFTRWQDAIPIKDGSAAVVAAALETHVFNVFGLPERLHSDQGAQFESALMAELCKLMRINKSHTTPYHPQGNGVVERNNKALGDSLRALLLGQDQEQWDLLVPHIMRTFRATPHRSTGETPNFMMLGRELRLPDILVHEVVPAISKPVTEYVLDLERNLSSAHDLLRDQQLKVRVQDTEEPPLYSVGDTVWLLSKRRRKGTCHKLLTKFLGPYRILEVYENHTYKIECRGQISVEHEFRLKPYRHPLHVRGRAPVSVEPRRLPNMRGRRRPVRRATPVPVSGQVGPPGLNGDQGGRNHSPSKPGDNQPTQAEPVVTRSGRAVKAPTHLGDYVTRR
jgi:transposase InsO family protein